MRLEKSSALVEMNGVRQCRREMALRASRAISAGECQSTMGRLGREREVGTKRMN